MLEVSRQGFYSYLASLARPYKYEALVALIRGILAEDECNDTYGSVRIWEALELLRDTKMPDLYVPSETTIRRIMCDNGLNQKKKQRPKGLTKADKLAQKSDNLLMRNFTAQTPYEKLVGDITELPTADGKLYIAALEDCYNNEVLGLAMDDNMRADLCIDALNNALCLHPMLRCGGVIAHSDRGSQYTSHEYRKQLEKFGISQSMNSAAGRCLDNAKAESLWGRFKCELIYGRYVPAKMSMQAVKTLVWRYFMSYWNNRRICSANGGLPPALLRRQFFLSSALPAA